MLTKNIGRKTKAFQLSLDDIIIIDSCAFGEHTVIKKLSGCFALNALC